MHRLGALAHLRLPAALVLAPNPPLRSLSPSPVPTGVSITGSNSPAGKNSWNGLHVHLLSEALHKMSITPSTVVLSALLT